MVSVEPCSWGPHDGRRSFLRRYCPFRRSRNHRDCLFWSRVVVCIVDCVMVWGGVMKRVERWGFLNKSESLLTAQGFFVNASTPTEFNPQPHKKGDHFASTLPATLRSVGFGCSLFPISHPIISCLSLVLLHFPYFLLLLLLFTAPQTWNIILIFSLLSRSFSPLFVDNKYLAHIMNLPILGFKALQILLWAILWRQWGGGIRTLYKKKQVVFYSLSPLYNVRVISQCRNWAPQLFGDELQECSQCPTLRCFPLAYETKVGGGIPFWYWSPPPSPPLCYFFIILRLF